MKFILISATLFLLFACSNTESNKEENIAYSKDSLQKLESEESNISPDIQNEKLNEKLQYDSLIKHYLEVNKEKFEDGPDYRIAYLTDKTERNGKTYFTVQIGADDESRFTTMQWLYIDTASKQIFELDNVEDQLILWP